MIIYFLNRILKLECMIRKFPTKYNTKTVLFRRSGSSLQYKLSNVSFWDFKNFIKNHWMTVTVFNSQPFLNKELKSHYYPITDKLTIQKLLNSSGKLTYEEFLKFMDKYDCMELDKFESYYRYL